MRTHILRGLLITALGASLATFGCSPSVGHNQGAGDVGTVGFALDAAPGVTLGSISYSITGPSTRSGSVDTSHSATLSFVVGGLSVGGGYSIALSSTVDGGGTQCAGSAAFAVAAHQTTAVSVHVTCHEAAQTGSVLVNGTLNVCPTIDGLSATPAEVLVGNPIALSATAHDVDGGPSPLTYHWSATSGTLSDASAASPTLTCTTGGAVTVTLAVSDGDCGDTLAATVTCTGAPRVVINEVESNGDPVGDWVELTNAGTAAVDISGYELLDNDDTHPFVVVPAGTTLAPGGFFAIYVFQTFGLGAPDSARLYDPSGTLIDSYSWTTHAVGTYGRCPDGTGPFVDSAPSRGAPNNCGGGTGGAAGGSAGAGGSAAGAGGGAAGAGGGAAGAGGGAAGAGGGAAGAGGTGGASQPIVINEVESNGDPVGDWVELTNIGAATVDISGYKLKDNDDTHAFVVVPAGTTLASGGFFAIYVFQTFGLGAPDMARLFDPSGTLIDSYSWTAHAMGTYGRCPDGTGPFVDSAPSRGAPNNCGGGTGGAGGAGGAGGTGGAGGMAGNEFAWPGTDTVITVDDVGEWASNLSGLSYQPATATDPAVLWGIDNGPSKLYRLLWNGATWESDPLNSWGMGKTIHYPTGVGDPDSEGVSKAEWADAAIYVSTERDNDANTINRFSILRYDTTASGTDLTATNEWDVTADLPAMGINLGLEAITYIPDTALVAGGFIDQSTNAPYVPANYANHGTGLFFVGLESNGSIYAYALNHADSTFIRVATFPSGQVSIMDLSYDREVGYLWAQCDNTCDVKATVFRLDAAPASPTFGTFQAGRVFDRPDSLPDSNFEGIGIAPEAECAGGQKHFFWSDDSALDGHSLRRGSIPCGAFF